MSEELSPELVIAGVVIAVTTMTIFVGFGWLLYKAGRLKHPEPLVISISLLTALALLGFLITKAEEAANLAAVGIGALAGSLAVVFRGKDGD